MDLESLQFIVYVAGVCIIYFLCRNESWQRRVLIAVGIVCYYMMSGLSALLLLLATGILTYFLGIRIGSCISEAKRNRENEKLALALRKKARFCMWIGCIAELGMLMYFKFFTNTWTLLQKLLLAHYQFKLFDLLIPLSISYFTLALSGYILDVYHAKIEAEKDFEKFSLMFLYFPCMIQGPINAYKKLKPEIEKLHTADYERIRSGVLRMVWGYIMKIVFADRIGIMVSAILDSEAVGFPVLCALVLYSFQIYGNFAGGINVIMGISEILDIRLVENFHNPFMAKSVTEYWKRWHISLGEWMENHVFYPIVFSKTVNRISKAISNKYLRRVFSATAASFIVFIFVGIWHGTGWNYVVYGIYQATFVSLAILLEPLYEKGRKLFHIQTDKALWHLFQMVRTFFILVIGRYFSHAPNLMTAIQWLKRTFCAWNPETLVNGTFLEYGLDIRNIILMFLSLFVILFVDYANEQGICFRQKIVQQKIAVRWTVYYAALFLIIIFGVYGPEFTVSSFIYQGF